MLLYLKQILCDVALYAWVREATKISETIQARCAGATLAPLSDETLCIKNGISRIDNCLRKRLMTHKHPVLSKRHHTRFKISASAHELQQRKTLETLSVRVRQQ